MKVKVKLDKSFSEDILASKGFIISFGEYGDATECTFRISFDEGLDLLNQLLECVKKYREALDKKLIETGKLARIEEALKKSEEVNTDEI